jgi:hypothetical protein
MGTAFAIDAADAAIVESILVSILPATGSNLAP